MRRRSQPRGASLYFFLAHAQTDFSSATFFEGIMSLTRVSDDKASPAVDPLIIQPLNGLKGLISIQPLVHKVQDPLAPGLQSQIQEYAPGILHQFDQIRGEGTGPRIGIPCKFEAFPYHHPQDFSQPGMMGREIIVSEMDVTHGSQSLYLSEFLFKHI